MHSLTPKDSDSIGMKCNIGLGYGDSNIQQSLRIALTYSYYLAPSSPVQTQTPRTAFTPSEGHPEKEEDQVVFTSQDPGISGAQDLVRWDKVPSLYLLEVIGDLLSRPQYPPQCVWHNRTQMWEAPKSSYSSFIPAPPFTNSATSGKLTSPSPFSSPVKWGQHYLTLVHCILTALCTNH